MSSNKKTIDEVENLLNEAGYTVPELIKCLGKKNSKLLMLDETNYQKFAELYDSIVAGRLNKLEKGKRLEDLTALLFQKSVPGFFDVYRNCRTSTNEIDMLIRWTENAKLSHINSSFPCFGESFLCECKNYEGKVEVTYVGKFCHLMNSANTNLGIMVAWEGVTGRDKWSDSRGLIKKYALKENRYIIVLDKTDFSRIYKKETNLFSLIDDKYEAIKNEIDYKKFILKHDAEDMLL